MAHDTRIGVCEIRHNGLGIAILGIPAGTIRVDAPAVNDLKWLAASLRRSYSDLVTGQITDPVAFAQAILAPQIELLETITEVIEAKMGTNQ